uniref:SCP domain-containing protein n=1 Tax=Caenorhabditis tropicalis TaxID=1561998 RepID=A0A1I7U2G5_9PELO
MVKSHVPGFAKSRIPLTWNHLLQRNASLIAQNCGKSLPGFAVRFDLEYLPIAPAEQGKELAERFLSSKQSVRRQESELYIPYQWDNTKIGCAHAPKCQKIICVFGGPNSILFLIVQCATLEYTLVAEAPNEETMATEVLASLNGARKLVNHRIGADIRWLKWDLSLAWMASKASCDSVDGSIRLRLSQGPTGYLVDDVTTNIKNFTDHILKNGADPANATEEFSKYYEFYRSDLTRVGCAFKFCQGTGEETNLICFLGPRIETSRWRQWLGEQRMITAMIRI